MAERTGISWTDRTFNPVWGCTKISPACDHCYAEGVAARFAAGAWGPHGTFREFGDHHWNAPIRWDRQAEREGTRSRVFCSSMADVFDKRWPVGIRDRLWRLIRTTPFLDWQLLTKRPQNIAGMLPPDWGEGWPNVWLGVTAENQEEADRRIPILLRTPAAIRFASCEPLLGPLDLRSIALGDAVYLNALSGFHECRAAMSGGLGTVPAFLETWNPERLPKAVAALDWVIVGGESGRGARPMRFQWAVSVLGQCLVNGVPAWFKQTGSNKPPGDWPDCTGKGDDPGQWPLGVRVQQFPAPAAAP